MKGSDYIVDFLIKNGVDTVFGYPGGMVTHLMDSLSKRKNEISSYTNHHEQAAAFAACAYAQVSGKTGVAFATSGPGASNLITGIAEAYFSSTPCLFITGQVNTYEQKNDLPVRQKGFQEMSIAEMVKPIVKYGVSVRSSGELEMELNKAFKIAISGRMGPVLLDIPFNVQRDEYDFSTPAKIIKEEKSCNPQDIELIVERLQKSKRPVLILGAGIKQTRQISQVRKLCAFLRVPVVTSMIAMDILPHENDLMYGFIGAYGSRTANIIMAKSDLVVVLGSRLTSRQIGNNKDDFAPHAEIIRVDIDENEFTNRIKDNEITINSDMAPLLSELVKKLESNPICKNEWLEDCNKIKEKLTGFDASYSNQIIELVSKSIHDNLTITTDVGQNQVWVAQSFQVKENQKILFSGGNGAMGFSLPAAIGTYYATKQPVVCFTGDGGFQMNIQEMQHISRFRLPIKIVLLNNSSLGMIRHFQEMYFDSIYTQTVEQGGYTTPDFEKIAKAYDVEYHRIRNIEDLEKIKEKFSTNTPKFFEVVLASNTCIYPKSYFNKPIYDQDPLLGRELLNELLDIEGCYNS